MNRMDDSISRQAAIDAVNSIDNLDAKARGGICIKLMGLPSAQPEQQWIPCSERLPDSGRYLVSCSLSVFSPQVVNYDADDGEWFYDGCKSIGYEMPAINAWMPLPEPYREGGQDENR